MDRVIVLNTRDFNFLGKKEFFLLFLFLLTLVFSQLALEFQHSPNHQDSFIVVESSFLEDLGLLVPIFTILFLFAHNRRKQDYSWLPPLTWVLLFIVFFLAISALPAPKDMEGLFPENNTTSTTTIPLNSTSTTVSLIPPPDTNDITEQLQGSSFLLEFLQNFRVLFIVAFLALPLFLFFVIRTRSNGSKQDIETDNDLTFEEKQKQFRMKTILECYLQASETLEDHGADKSPSITPTEFIDDVTEKRLTRKDAIGGITELYEEARFSRHQITLDKVAKAKEISRNIIQSWWEEEKSKKKQSEEKQ